MGRFLFLFENVPAQRPAFRLRTPSRSPRAITVIRPCGRPPGYKANERPRLFDLDGEVYEIVSVLDGWYEPSARYFKVRTTDFKVFVLRYDEQADEWTLQSGFDGDELLARPAIELVPVERDPPMDGSGD